MKSFDITLNTIDPLARARIRKTVWDVAGMMDAMALELEAQHAGSMSEYEVFVNTIFDDLIITRLFCGVAFAAAQAMIDGVRAEG